MSMSIARNIKSPGRANAGGIQNTELSTAKDTAAPSAVKAAVTMDQSVFDPEISVIGRVTENKPTPAFKLRHVLALIKGGKWKKRVQMVRDDANAGDKEAVKKRKKKELPAALFSGVFSRAQSDALIEHSGIVSVDVDLGDNPKLETDLSQVRASIESDPHTLALFLSPSGTGLKILLRCDPKRPHIESFNAAQRHFRERFGLTVDKGCSDVCRRCFVSFDPNLFQRDDAPVLTYTDADSAHHAQSDASSSAAKGGVTSEMPRDLGALSKEDIRRILSFIPTRPDYPDWLDILSAVFSVLPFDEGFEVLEEWSPEEEIGQYRDKYDHRLTEIGVGTLIHIAKKHGFDPKSPRNPDGVGAPSPFPIWGPLEFEFHQPDENVHLLGNGFLQRGEFTSLVGFGGLGKTRLTLWWAVCHILGKDWCGLPTKGGPEKWLFLSTETSLARWKNDLARMLDGLSADQLLAIHANLRFLAITPDEEGVINLGEEESQRRLEATLRLEHPAVVVLDPFSDAIAGDENATADVVSTLRILRRIQRKTVPKAAVIIIHHARTGVSNVAQAGDNFAAGNFARGSKALYSRVRCELQLAPADRDDTTKLVLCCGKANDCEKFDPRGIVFDQGKFSYEVDPSFDLEAWRRDLEGKRSGTIVSVAEVVRCVRDAIQADPAGGKEASTGSVAEAVRNATGASLKTVQRCLGKAAREGFLKAGRKRGYWAIGAKSLP